MLCYFKKINLNSSLNLLESNFIGYFLIISDLKKNNVKVRSFFKEGMYIDSLQKMSVDKLVTKLFVSSTQIFNINYLNYKFIKFFIDEIYKKLNFYLGGGDDLSFYTPINNAILLFIWVFQFIMVLSINIYFS